MLNAQAEEKTIPIIAIGDLHADISSAKKAFELAKITDADGKWIISDVIVVQTGDITDRGPDGLAILEWIRSLEQAAPKHNSQFYSLIGNHEAMNLIGDWRYVSPLDLQSFGGKEQRITAFSKGGVWREWFLTHEAVININGNIFLIRCDLLRGSFIQLIYNHFGICKLLTFINS